MEPQKNKRLSLFLIGSMILAGCGGADDPSTAAPLTARTVSGNVSKGPLSGATVRAFAVDTRGRVYGNAIDQTTTDNGGNWSMDLPSDSGNVIIVSSGGSYVDEADPEPDPAFRRMVQLQASDSFAVLLPAGATTVSINLYTDALLRKSRFETEGDNFLDVYALNRSFLNDAFGFDAITTVPADPIRPDANAAVEALQYAMAIGGAANVVNAMAVANQLTLPDFAVISALIDDLGDCIVDGHGVAGPIDDVVTVTLDLNLEILRFRNNNHAAYAGIPLLQLDQSQCARSGRLPDITAPVFFNFPDNFVVESADGGSVDTLQDRVQSALMPIRAIDDRDGEVAFSSDLPDVLPPGVTTVNYSAMDLAGNLRTASVTITVLAPAPPVIVAPPDIVARSIGELTPVNLGIPEVSDNVSPADRLRVENNAPANGFARGEYLITWTVTDEAGLSAQAVQQVNVGTEPGYGGDEVGSDATLLPVFPGEQPIGGVPGRGLPIALPVFSPGPAGGAVTHPVTLPVPAGNRHRVYSFPGATADHPSVLNFAPGRHFGSVRLVAPCDNVVLMGPAELTGIDGLAVVVEACRNVSLVGLSVSHSARGGVLATDSELYIDNCDFAFNVAARGGAVRAIRSGLTIERSSFSANAATFGGGAIWLDRDSSAFVRDSVFSGNYAIADGYRHARLILSNVALDAAAIAMERADP